MAAKRQDRFLERQRGAGTRQIKNTGFNLLLPGQESVFDIPLQPQKSGRLRKTPQSELLPQKSGRSRKTSQPELLPQRSTRQTPAPEATQQQQLASRKTPTTINPKKRGRPRTLLEIDDEEGTRDDGARVVAKKRKPNVKPKARKTSDNAKPMGKSDASEVQVKDSQPTEPGRSALLIGEVKKRKKRRSIGQQSIRKAKPPVGSPLKPIKQPQKRGPKSKTTKAAEPMVSGTPEPPQYSRITTPAVQETQQSQVLPGAESAEDAVRPIPPNASSEKKELSSSSKKRKRDPDDKGPTRRRKPKGTKETIAGNTIIEKPTADKTQEKFKRGRKPGSRNKTREKVASGDDVTEQRLPEVAQPVQKTANTEEALAEEPDNITATDQDAVPQQQPKPQRKKRRSIGQQSLKSKPKAKDMNVSEKPTSKRPSTSKPILPPGDALSHSKSPRPQSPTNNEPADTANEPAQEEGTQPATDLPPKKKRGRPPKSKSAASPLSKPPSQPPPQNPNSKTESTKPPASKSRPPPPNTIPITYYVPASASPSPSSTPTTTTHPQPNPTINAIDVLSQVLLDILSSIDPTTLTSPPQTPTSAQTTLSLYRSELSSQLLQHTSVLNLNTTLKSQLRKQNAEERELKREIKYLKEERERVKRRKEEVMKEREGRRLEGLLEGIRGAVRRGWEMEREKVGKGEGVVDGGAGEGGVSGS